MDGVPHWVLPCTDAMGRPKTLGITVTRQGAVALIAPAGEAAIVGPDQIESFCGLLIQARTMSLRGSR
jgi:hypothetical protein